MNDDNDNDNAQRAFDDDVDNEVEEDGSDWEEVAIEQPLELEITIQQSDRNPAVKSVLVSYTLTKYLGYFSEQSPSLVVYRMLNASYASTLISFILSA